MYRFFPFLIIVLLISSCIDYGGELNTKNLKLFYSGNTDLKDAETVSNYLASTSFIDSFQKNVRIIGKGDSVEIQFIFPNELRGRTTTQLEVLSYLLGYSKVQNKYKIIKGSISDNYFNSLITKTLKTSTSNNIDLVFGDSLSQEQKLCLKNVFERDSLLVETPVVLFRKSGSSWISMLEIQKAEPLADSTYLYLKKLSSQLSTECFGGETHNLQLMDSRFQPTKTIFHQK